MRLSEREGSYMPENGGGEHKIDGRDVRVVVDISSNGTPIAAHYGRGSHGSHDGGETEYDSLTKGLACTLGRGLNIYLGDMHDLPERVL